MNRTQVGNGSGYALEVLAKVLPRELLLETLADWKKVPKRASKLPPELVAWLVIAMGLFRNLSIPNVLARITERFSSSKLPHSTTIAEARDRLGWHVVEDLFKRLARALTVKHDQVVRWHGFVVSALDGTTAMTPDTNENETEFGRPATTRGGSKSAFPKLRAVMVVGVFSHIITHALIAPYRESELATAAKLAKSLSAHSLLLMDRLYYSFAWLVGLGAQCVEFITRAKTGEHSLKKKRIKRLPDGSELVDLMRPSKLSKQLPLTLRVRLIRFQVKGYRPLTVVTSLLDFERFPANEIGALYHARWEVELSCRELKTYQAGTQVTFRSKTPDRVKQEAYGLLIAYNCMRGLIAEAAHRKGVEPRQLAFVDSLERIRAAIIAYDPDTDPDELHEKLVVALGAYVLPPRRAGRCCPRAVKVKFSKWPRKRPGSNVVATSRDPR